MNLVKMADDFCQEHICTSDARDDLIVLLNEVYTIAWVHGSNDDWSHGEEE